MTTSHRWFVPLVFAACLPLASCQKAADTAADDEHEVKPATVEHLKGPQPTRVTLTEDAARRIDVQTAHVADTQVAGEKRKVIPYASVLYDVNGDTWTWINSSPLTFVRTPIKIDSIDGDKAVLTDGPDPGALVVTVGATELFGSETEFEEE
jgi:hypothetical protein